MRKTAADVSTFTNIVAKHIQGIEGDVSMAFTVFLRLPAVQNRTGKSRSSIYAGGNDGTFPKPIKIGPRAVGWLEAEIEAHNQACIDASRPSDPA